MNEELKKLNEDLSKAEKAKDIPFFEQHLSENLLFRRASGALNTKAQFLEALLDGGLTYHENEPHIIQITPSKDGSKAVVQAIVYAHVTKKDKDNEGQSCKCQETKGHYMNLRFFELQDSIWKIVSWYNYTV